MAIALEALSAALSRPDRFRIDLLRERAQRRLINFIELMWPTIEPATPFVNGWALGAICEHLEDVTLGKTRKLLINVPPGCMKSLTTNVFWPAWEWGPRRLAHHKFITASYHQGLTVRDNRRCRNLLVSELYQEMWGDRFRLSDDQNAKVRFDNDKTGFKLAIASGGMTGERGNRVTIDDPHSVQGAESEAERESTLFWFTETVPTRITNPDTDAFVVIMQRVHERDVSGLILARDLGYTVLCLPMEYERDHPHRWVGDPRTQEGELLWEERFSREYLEKDLKPTLRAKGGTYAEAGQLQQRPAPRGGGMFKTDDWRYCEAHHAPRGGQTVRAWDLAATDATEPGASAWTVGVKMRLASSGQPVIEDIVRFQGGPAEVDRRILATAQADGQRVIVSLPQDPGQAGKAQRAHFARMLHGHRVSFMLQTGSKADRAAPLASQVEAHNVLLVRAPWNETFTTELAVFPVGALKDQGDAAAQAYHELVRRQGTELPGTGEVVTGSSVVAPTVDGTDGDDLSGHPLDPLGDGFDDDPYT